MLQLIEKEIMDASEELLALDNLIGKIDAYLSLAVAADTFGLNAKPEINDLEDVSTVKIVQARNLLSEFEHGSFRPIDFQMVNGVNILAEVNG